MTADPSRQGEPAARSEVGAAASNSEADETSAVYDVGKGPDADTTAGGQRAHG